MKRQEHNIISLAADMVNMTTEWLQQGIHLQDEAAVSHQRVVVQVGARWEADHIRQHVVNAHRATLQTVKAFLEQSRCKFYWSKADHARSSTRTVLPCAQGRQQTWELELA